MLISKPVIFRKDIGTPVGCVFDDAVRPRCREGSFRSHVEEQLISLFVVNATHKVRIDNATHASLDTSHCEVGLSSSQQRLKKQAILYTSMMTGFCIPSDVHMWQTCRHF